MNCHNAQEKAAHVGFDWVDVGGVLAKLREEVAELEAEIASGNRAAAELGDLLYVCTSPGTW